jgi:signal transduction histidine kinase
MFELFQEYPEIFFSCTVLLALMFFYFVHRVSKAYKAARAKHDKVVFGLRNSHEGAVLKAQLDMQEYTFQMISREVHDNIGQNLSLAKLILNTQSFEDPDESAVQVNNSVKMVRTAIKDLVDVADAMNSDIMKYNGLVKAIEAEVKKLNTSHVYKITYDISGYVVFLEGPNEIILYRIVQETLQNIIKHANATLIAIHLYYYATYFKLAIQDNGDGFSSNNVNRGIGLLNIHNRCADLKGTCSIISNQSGTQIYIEIPSKPPVYA